MNKEYIKELVEKNPDAKKVFGSFLNFIERNEAENAKRVNSPHCEIPTLTDAIVEYRKENNINKFKFL